MISRTYVVVMPEAESATPLDILVQDDPGTQADPVVAGGDGAYYELRGRPLRVPVEAGASPPSAAAVGAGFVPRLRLGFSLSVVPLASAIVTDVPGVRLSESLISLASTDGGPLINVPSFADPAGGPAIRLTGGAETAGVFFLVSLVVNEAKDEDCDAQGPR